jgi:hypothetical protein
LSLRAVLPASFLTLVTAAAQVLTSQYDNARTGATLNETTLTPANVNARQFGKIFSLQVDGDIYAQPLYMPNLEIPGKGKHNVLFVATEHNSVYAFDADGPSSQPLWHASFLNSKTGVTTVSARDAQCPFITPEIGITPTPVIDLQTGTLYVLARTTEDQGFFGSPRFVQRLHALAVTTGVEKFGGPVEIKAAAFDPLRELPRAALLLAGGHVFLTWGSSCDIGPYHGWVMAYDAHTLAQTAVFNTSPESGESGIWQSDNGPAVDDEGNVYVVTGNGQFNVAGNARNYGDTVLKLALTGSGFVVRDYFTPSNESKLNKADADLGSGGPILVPPHLLLIGGKEGVLYVLDRDRMGKFHPDADGNVIQSFRVGDGIYAAPACWSAHVYVLAGGGYLLDFALHNGRLSNRPVTMGDQRFGNPGATPSISANGNRNGIVWLIETKAWNATDKPAVLHAYDARNVTFELYNSEQNAARDRAGRTLRFTVPTIANGRVYVEAKREVDVYGLLPPH